MHYFFLYYLTLFFSYSQFINCQEQISINYNSPVISFEKELIDLGSFMQYDDSSSRCEFVFTNTGKEPLIISKAKGSCGCTVPNWPKEPIMPGDSGVIKVNYDEKRVGSFNKSITITSNAQNSPKIVKVKGKVNAIPKTSEQPIKKQSSLAPRAN